MSGNKNQGSRQEARGMTASLTTLDEAPFQKPLDEVQEKPADLEVKDPVGDDLPVELDEEQEAPVQEEVAPVRLEVAMLREYAAAMAPLQFQDDNSIRYNQEKLYNAVVRTFTSPLEDAEAMLGCREVLNLFREFKDGAFHMAFIFRGWVTFLRDFPARKHEFEAIATILIAVANERPVNVDWAVVQSRLQPEHAERTLRRLMAISGVQVG